MPDNAAPQHGPPIEQLGLKEDCERLASIGELILDGHARLEDFELTEWELVFLRGYLGGAK